MIIDIKSFAYSTFPLALIVAGCVLFLAFIVDLTLCIFAPMRLVKKRGWYFLALAFCLLLLSGYSLLIAPDLSEGAFYPVVTASFGLLFYLPIVVVASVRRERAEKEKEEEGENYSPFLENNAFINKLRRSCQRVEEVKAVPVADETSIKEDVDFSHVKNVIERMNYYQLTAPDRKQVNDLKLLVLAAESGESLPDLKEKINDGLGGLLKLMSKYRV